MAHCVVPEAEEILDKEFPVLNKGFVRLVDYIGGDSRIVQAARVSYGEGTKSYREDKGLINYLLRNDHTSPFEQVGFTFHIKMPIFIARQWVRHRTASLNEISGRYSIMKEDFYLPSEEDISFQSTDNRQGRSDSDVPADMKKRFVSIMNEDQKSVYSSYRTLVDDGIARELARINLPLSLYTEMYWKMDLHNLFHFLRLRMGTHAQMEIRVYAEIIFDIISRVCPAACGAFKDHILGSVRFSRKEMDALREKLEGNESALHGRAAEIFEEKLQSD